ncbi:sigma 54-interacting transcriptional regulator [Thermodesulfobacteriota bacterium]
MRASKTTTAATNRRAKEQLATLHKISQASLHQHNLSILLEEVLDILETDMGMVRGILTLKSPDSDVFVIEASKGLTEQEKIRGQYKLGEGIVGRVAQTEQPMFIKDINLEPDFLNKTRSRKEVDRIAFLCVPVLYKRQVIGTISIDRPTDTDEMLKTDLDFLKLLSELLAEAVANIREQVAERESLMEENKLLRQQLGELYQPSNIVGKCNAMHYIYMQIAQVADSTATVLIRGESGTGKEMIARGIHFSSSRKSNPFVAVNCAALPENLIESELFGHEKGAFSGAVQQRKGRFELANGGTIFLDEIGDISPAVQVSLLRVLQERSFERVGGTETISVNIRVIAATSKNLEEAIEAQRFREDLYYRLNVFPIHMPALRERKSDIILLADHFLQKYNEMYAKDIKRISTSAINMMMAYHWPGNVRELENCIERAVLSSTDNVIHGYLLPPSLQTSEQTNTSIIPEEGADLTTMVNSYERELIVDSLKRFRGNVAAATRHLHTTQRVLHYKIKNLGIEPHNYR